MISTKSYAYTLVCAVRNERLTDTIAIQKEILLWIVDYYNPCTPSK